MTGHSPPDHDGSDRSVFAPPPPSSSGVAKPRAGSIPTAAMHRSFPARIEQGNSQWKRVRAGGPATRSQQRTGSGPAIPCQGHDGVVDFGCTGREARAQKPGRADFQLLGSFWGKPASSPAFSPLQGLQPLFPARSKSLRSASRSTADILRRLVDEHDGQILRRPGGEQATPRELVLVLMLGWAGLESQGCCGSSTRLVAKPLPGHPWILELNPF